MTADLVIGLDSSTTATKAIAWDRKGTAVAEGRAPIPLHNPQTDWFEQDPDDWWQAAAKSLRVLTRKIDPNRIAALGISNQRETFSQFDAAGTPLRPGTVWLDERCKAQVKSVSEKLGADHIHQISGKPPDVIPCLYRCVWFAEHMPEIWARTEKTTEVHGFLTFKLTGKWVTSTGSADPMGLLNLARMDWSDELIAAASLERSQLPELRQPGEIMGVVASQAAKATGLKAGTPIVAGGGDGQCAGTGTGFFHEACAYINLGTAVVSGSFNKRYAYARDFRTMTAVSDEGYIYESCLKAGTFLLHWITSNLFGVDPRKTKEVLAALETEARQSPIGSNGLMLVPYWSGVMTPYWDAAARGIMAGFSSSQKRGDVYRSILEGIAMEQTIGTDNIAAASEPIHSYIAIGGGAMSDLWCEIIADCSGREVRRLATVEASSLGAAMAAAKGAGWFATIPDASASMAGKPVRIFAPRNKEHRRYRQLLDIYRDLWPTLAQWNGRMAEFIGGSHG